MRLDILGFIISVLIIGGIGCGGHSCSLDCTWYVDAVACLCGARSQCCDLMVWFGLASSESSSRSYSSSLGRKYQSDDLWPSIPRDPQRRIYIARKSTPIRRKTGMRDAPCSILMRSFNPPYWFRRGNLALSHVLRA